MFQKRMRLPFVLFVALLAGLVNFHVQGQAKAREVYNEEFKWRIAIPAGFTSVSPQDWEKMQNKGAAAIEDTYGAELINQARTIFVFKNGDFNYFESNFQPFDPKTDGDYLASNKQVNSMLFETFKAQMPNVRLDSSSTTQAIGNLKFQKFDVRISFPNGMVLHALMYSRLFDKKELTVSMMYVDEKQGKQMMDSWLNSKFE